MVSVAARLRAAWAALRGYEAARPTPQHLARPFNSRRSPDASVETGGTSLREWGTYLDENHDLAIGVLDDLVTNVVGTGILVEPMPEVGGRVSVAAQERILDAWEEWITAPEVTSELPWGELQRLTCRSWLRDGEFFAQHVRSTAPYAWPAGSVRYRVEYLEAAMVPHDLQRDNPRYRYGVYSNDWNQPVAYDVYLTHPNDFVTTGTGGAMFGAARVKQVAAEDLLHCKFARRWPQTRGVPIVHGIIRRLTDLKEYEESERIAARVAASMCAYIRKSPDNAPQRQEDDGEREMRFSPGKIFDNLVEGEDVGTIDTGRPSAELMPFRQGQLRAIASGTGTRYSSIAKDYSGTYASQRQEMVESRPHYLRLRNYYVAKFIRPVYETWLRQAWLQGVLGIPDRVDFNALKKAAFVGPGQPWIDPLKEVQADVLAIENGLVTREQVIRMRGGDPRTVPAPDTPPADTRPNLTAVPDDDEDEDSAATGT